MWRQGDVLIETLTKIPETATRLKHLTLAEGELTGHMHRIAEAEAAELYEGTDELYLNITAESATVVHNEHGPIKLPRGAYRVWKQREYSPLDTRFVRD
jgi:hypothetical protein